MAMRYRAKIHNFIDLLHVFPTMAEVLKIVAISRAQKPSQAPVALSKVGFVPK
jgi:mercuric reductase